MVEVTYTVVDPGAMVVHFLDTPEVCSVQCAVCSITA